MKSGAVVAATVLVSLAAPGLAFGAYGWVDAYGPQGASITQDDPWINADGTATYSVWGDEIFGVDEDFNTLESYAATCDLGGSVQAWSYSPADELETSGADWIIDPGEYVLSCNVSFSGDPGEVHSVSSAVFFDPALPPNRPPLILQSPEDVTIRGAGPTVEYVPTPDEWVVVDDYDDPWVGCDINGEYWYVDGKIWWDLPAGKHVAVCDVNDQLDYVVHSYTITVITDAEPDRVHELRRLYGSDAIYGYAAWLEYSGATGPRTTIHNSTVSWSFADSKQNHYDWSMPIITYENLVKQSADKSLYGGETHLLGMPSGETVTMQAFEGFVQGDFEDVIDAVYENARDDYDFIHEVWYIVSQMTVYAEDVDPSSEGRFALETFTRGGGDCEDLAILVADMLRSSSHTRDWEIQLVYMDSDRPGRAWDASHVLVYVDTGPFAVYVEAAGESDMYSDYSHYPDGISGWYYDV